MQALAREALTLDETDDRGALIAEGSKIVTRCVANALDSIGQTQQLFENLWRDRYGGLTDSDRHKLIGILIRSLCSSAQLGTLVSRDVLFFQTLHTELTAPTVRAAPDEGDRYRLVRLLLDAVFTDAALKVVLPERKGFVVALLMTAARMANVTRLAAHHSPPGAFVRAKLMALGEASPYVATAFVDAHWGADPAELGPDLLAWIFNTVTVKEWNDPERELGARGLNLLWTAGDYAGICTLVANGINCTLSAKAWGGPTREGVYTGYVQPLTHVLGRYVKSVALLDAGKVVTDVTKVEGARQIIQAIGKLTAPPAILLNYHSIKSCEMITLFEQHPGTIWGFEDVRLPYVLAARETSKGQRPLRMLDMWDAITPALNFYANLVTHPTATIDSALREGIESVRRGVKEGKRQYEGIDLDGYLLTFLQTCRDFLTYFASRRPYGAYLEPTNRSGKAPSKLLPAYACKVGIHWSADRKIPLYYCLDGLDIQDVLSYRRYKYKEISAYLSALDRPTEQLLNHGPFQEIITLAEVREILRRWEKFRGVVRFVEQGRVVSQEDAEGRVREWRAQLTKAETGLQRTWTEKATFEPDILELSGDAMLWQDVGTRERWRCVKELTTITLAAKRVEGPALLLQVFQDDCPTLRRLGLLPDGFVEAFRAAVEADPTSRPDYVSWLRRIGYLLLCQGLRKPMHDAIDLYFGPLPLLLMPPPQPLTEVELHVDPIPGTVLITSTDPDPGSPPTQLVTAPSPADTQPAPDSTGSSDQKG